MKTFYEYLAESNKEYALRIKFATDITEAMLDRMETHLEKYGVKEITKPKKTIAQSNPMDFAESRGREVTIVDFVLDYPVVSDVLRDEICEATGLSRTHVVVRSPEDEPMNEEEAKSIAVCGKIRVLKEHTIKHRMSEMLVHILLNFPMVCFPSNNQALEN